MTRVTSNDLDNQQSPVLAVNATTDCKLSVIGPNDYRLKTGPQGYSGYNCLL